MSNMEPNRKKKQGEIEKKKKIEIWNKLGRDAVELKKYRHQ